MTQFTALPIPTTLLDNATVTSTGSTTARSLASRFADVINVKDFGAVGNGVADDTGAIQAAINQAILVGGGTVFLPLATYKVTSALQITSSTVHLIGAGRNCTFIVTNSSTSDVIEFGGSCFDSSVEALTISSSAASPSAGAGVMTSNGVGVITVRDCRVQNTYNGIFIDNAVAITGTARILATDISTIWNDGIAVFNCSQVFISDVTTFQNAARPGNAGLHFIAGGGFYILNTTCGGNAVGLQINPTTGNTVFDVFASNLELDSCGSTGVFIDSSGGGTIIGVQLANTRTGFTTGKGFAINGSNTTGLMLANCKSERNSQEGLWINNGGKVSVSNFHSLGNSALSAGSFNGIYVLGGDDIQITGGISGAYPGQTNHQNYGLAVDVAFTGHLLVDGLNVRTGNVTAGMINSASSGNVIISNQPPTIVSALPSPNGAQGSRFMVTDATTNGFNSIVSGSSATIVPVFSDGTNWRIG